MGRLPETIGAMVIGRMPSLSGVTAGAGAGEGAGGALGEGAAGEAPEERGWRPEAVASGPCEGRGFAASIGDGLRDAKKVWEATAALSRV